MIEKSSEIVGEPLERIFLGFIGFVSLTITQHIRCDNPIASLNPRADLIFPGSPDHPRTMNK